MFKALSVVLLVLAAVACGEVKSKNNGTQCNSDGTCTDPSQVCDVDGSIGGTPNTCVSVMCTAGQFKACQGSNSAVVCNATGNGYDTMPCVNGCDSGSGCTAVTCTANQALRCDADQLVSCNADGNGAVSTTCPLGCDATALKCKGVDPSNNLASNLDQAAGQGDVALPDGTTINTDNGSVTGTGGAIAVANVIVSQSGGPMMRVLMAKSFTIGDVRVTGTAALAIVAAGDITLNGTLDLSADGVTAGPGAIACAGAGEGGANNVGSFSRAPAGNSGGYPTYLWNIGGGGGGGFGSVGGTGGAYSTASPGGAGGTTNGAPTLVPLRGGCPGGDGQSGPHGGRGGGAIQLVANGTVHLTGTATKKAQIHVGGGGGEAGELGRAATTDTNPVFGSGGGGAGGGVLIEAATVTLDAATGIWAAGGGGGGWGSCTTAANGMDAPPTAVTPSGGACAAGTTPAQTGGDGATTADGGTGQSSSFGSGGGGGGGLGRIRINTADATYTSTGATVRGTVTTAIVQSR